MPTTGGVIDHFVELVGHDDDGPPRLHGDEGFVPPPPPIVLHDTGLLCVRRSGYYPSNNSCTS